MKNTIFLFVCLIFFGCSKNESQIPVTNITHAKSLAVNTGIEKTKPKKFAEGACTINGCIGTLCLRSQGSCSKVRACQATKGGCTNDLTPGEIEASAHDHAMEMVAGGFIDIKDTAQSKALIRQLLSQRSIKK